VSAALSFAAALIHASVMAAHFREYWLFGLFFAIVTPLQVLWAGMTVRRPDDRRLLLAGAAGSFAIAAVWVVSRMVGLPFGPDAFEPEAIGAKDVLASYAEFAIVLLAVLRLRGRDPAAPTWVLAAAWVLAVVCLLAAFLAGH
jgi:hypothetical protein